MAQVKRNWVFFVSHGPKIFVDNAAYAEKGTYKSLIY